MTPPTNVTRTSEPDCKRRSSIGFSISSSLEDDCVWAIRASIKGRDEGPFSATSICHDFSSRNTIERGHAVRQCWFHRDDVPYRAPGGTALCPGLRAQKRKTSQQSELSCSYHGILLCRTNFRKQEQL